MKSYHGNILLDSPKPRNYMDFIDYGPLAEWGPFGAC